MTIQLNFGRDVQGFNAYAPYPSDLKYSVTIASGGNATLTLPTNVAKWIVNFSLSPGSDCWVAYQGATAAAPAGGTFAATTSELNPGQRSLNSTYISGGVITANTINIFNNGTGASDIGIVLYASS